MTRNSRLGGPSGRWLPLSFLLVALSPAATAAPPQPHEPVVIASSDEGVQKASGTGAGNEDERPTPPHGASTRGSETDPLPVYSPPRRATPRAMVSGGLRGTRGLPKPLALVPAHVALTSSSSPSLFWWISAVPPEGTTVTLTVTTDDEPEPLAEIALASPRSAGHPARAAGRSRRHALAGRRVRVVDRARQRPRKPRGRPDRERLHHARRRSERARGHAAQRDDARRRGTLVRRPRGGVGRGRSAAHRRATPRCARRSARAGRSDRRRRLSENRADAPQARRAPRSAEPLDRRRSARSCAASTRPASTGSRSGTTSTRPRPPAARSRTSRRSRCSARSRSRRARATIGCLVFYPGYRNPASLAKAATTLDHLSGGRFVLGLGGGWHEWEARAYGYDFPPIGTRLRPARRGLPDRPRPADPAAHHLRGQALPRGERVVPARAGPGAAADLDRRHRREADAADRRALRRRLERGLRVARGVHAPLARARRLVREERPRSRARSRAR